MLFLVSEIRKHLAEEELVRLPGDTSSELPVCFCEYEEGTPAPDDYAEQSGEAKESVPATVNIFYSSSEPTDFFEEFIERRYITIEVRAPLSKTGLELSEEITRSLDGRRHELIGNALVSSVRMLEAPRRVPWRYEGQGTTFSISFRVAVRRSDLEAA